MGLAEETGTSRLPWGSRCPPTPSHSASSRATALGGLQVLRAVEKAVSQGRRATPEPMLLSQNGCSPPKMMHIPKKRCTLQTPAMLDLPPEHAWHGETAAGGRQSRALCHGCPHEEGFGGTRKGDGGSPKAWVRRDVPLPQRLFGAASSLPHARLPDLPLPHGVSLMISYSALVWEGRMSRCQWEAEPKAPPRTSHQARRLSFHPQFSFQGDAHAHAGLFFCLIFI